MRRALDLAREGWGKTAPNPMVGAVLVRDGVVVGEGYHAQFGAAHAEVAALQAAGEGARGATLYVTLEPCAHHGKTPPCADAIAAAGVIRVVIAASDPNPDAAGGADRLRARGVAVEFGEGEAGARELNAPFFHRFAHPERPFVTLKMAVSIDGAIAAADRSTTTHLTGPESRREVHRLRAGHEAIAVGIGTVLADDPALTVRDWAPPRVPPTRVVFDSALRTPPDSLLARTAAEAPVLVVARDRPPERAARPRTPGGVDPRRRGAAGRAGSAGPPRHRRSARRGGRSPGRELSSPRGRRSPDYLSGAGGVGAGFPQRLCLRPAG